MNCFKKTTLIIFGIAFLAGLFAFSPTVASAQALEVDFQNDPLFSEANFLPGSEVVRTVEVKNNSNSSQSVLTEAINALDSEGLGDQLYLLIKEGATPLYNNTLGTFLRAGETSLSALGAGESTTYSFGVTFTPDADNDTQSSALSFDLCVGFEGGQTNCGGTVIGEEEETGGGGGGGSSGGGGGIIHSTPLEVFNEEVTNTDVSGGPTAGTAVIEWDSNLLSTSQVIYGLEENGSYSLNLTVLPYFGYPLGTVEDPIKVIHHVMPISGLEVGKTYIYRVVSRASPPSIGYEFEFVLTEGGEVIETGPIALTTGENNTGGGNTNNEGGGNPPTENSGGSNTFGSGDASGNNTSVASTTGNLAAALFGLPDSFGEGLKCFVFFLLLMLLVYIAWVAWKKVMYENYDPENLEAVKRRNWFFLLGSIIVGVLAYLFGLHCTLIFFIITIVVIALMLIWNYSRK